MDNLLAALAAQGGLVSALAAASYAVRQSDLTAVCNVANLLAELSAWFLFCGIISREER
jgi:hypothetical protein